MKLTKETKLWWMAIVLSISFIACQQAEFAKEAEVTLEEKSMEAAEESEAPLLNQREDILNKENSIPVVIPQKLIKTAKVNFEVDDYVLARKQLDSVKNRWGAYVMKENEEHEYGRVTTTVTLRVQNQYFESLLSGIGNVAKRIDNKTIDTYDVSEEFVDLQARLKTKREVEKRYLQILKNAHKIEEILAVEDDIRRIREEIEAKEGRLRYLNNRVTLSTITLTMYQSIVHDTPKYTPPSFFEKMGKALSNGWEGLLIIILGLTNIWPVIVFGGAVFYVARRILRKTNQKRT